MTISQISICNFLFYVTYFAELVPFPEGSIKMLTFIL